MNISQLAGVRGIPLSKAQAPREHRRGLTINPAPARTLPISAPSINLLIVCTWPGLTGTGGNGEE